MEQTQVFTVEKTMLDTPGVIQALQAYDQTLEDGDYGELVLTSDGRLVLQTKWYGPIQSFGSIADAVAWLKRAAG